MQEPHGDAISLFTPQRLAWVANVLFVVFSISLIDAAIPLRILDAGWQLTLISTLLNFAIFPLIGLGFVHLAADINPDDLRLTWRRSFLSRLAAFVSLGFLLLTLLHPLVLWHQLSLVEQGQFRPLRLSEQNVTNIRSTLQNSRSTEEIFKNLQAIKAPPMPAQYASLNLAQLRGRMQADLAIAEQQLRSLRAQTQATIMRSRIALLRTIVRNSFLSLAYGLGFAALAQRRSSLMPLLQEWQQGLVQMTSWLRPQRNPSAGSVHDRMTSFITALSEDEEQDKHSDGLVPSSRPFSLHHGIGKILQRIVWLMPAPRRPKGSLHDDMSSFIEEVNANDEDHPDDFAQPIGNNQPLHEWRRNTMQPFARNRPTTRPPQGSIHDEMANYIEEIAAEEEDHPQPIQD